MTGNEIELLQSVKYNLALLCPETDGLLPRYRIIYQPEGTTCKEQAEDLINYAYERFFSILKEGKNGKKYISQMDAHRISLIVCAKGFSQKEVFDILRNERYKKK